MEDIIGEIRMFSGDHVPPGWLPCDGQILETGKYILLYDRIGNRYGDSNRGTFMLPDLRGRAPRGGKIGEQVGKARATLTDVPRHRHNLAGQLSGSDAAQSDVPGTEMWLGRYKVHGSSSVAESFTPDPQGFSSLAPEAVPPTGGGPGGKAEPHENRQPFVTVMFCICYDGEWARRQ